MSTDSDHAGSAEDGDAKDWIEPPPGTADLPRLSPSALNRFLGCEYRTHLDILERRGELGEERRPPRLNLLFERGERHEDAVVEGLKAEGLDVLSLDDPEASVEQRAHRTVEAMREGRDVLHQACFANGEWVGYPDFLIRVKEPSDLGPWSYEVHDAKMGRHARPSHVFQLLFYTDELERIQGVRPERMHLMLGDGERPELAPSDFEAYSAVVRDAFTARYAQLAAGDDPVYPYPVAACQFCHWWHVCERKRRDDDHLSLVANLHRAQGLKLERAGVRTLPALAAVDHATPIPRMPADTSSSCAMSNGAKSVTGMPRRWRRW